MIEDKKREFVYIRTPKTGSTSFVNVWRDQNPGMSNKPTDEFPYGYPVVNHIPLNKHFKRESPSTTFAIVRDPFIRVISACMAMQRHSYPQGYGFELNNLIFEECGGAEHQCRNGLDFCNKVIGHDYFEDMCNRPSWPPPIRIDPAFATQKSFVESFCQNEIAADLLIPLQELGRHWYELLTLLNMNHVDLPQDNKGRYRKFDVTYLDSEAVLKITSVYGEDFDLVDLAYQSIYEYFGHPRNEKSQPV